MYVIYRGSKHQKWGEILSRGTINQWLICLENLEQEVKMAVNMLEKKQKLAPGEILKLRDDECFKIMFANKKHKRI